MTSTRGDCKTASESTSTWRTLKNFFETFAEENAVSSDSLIGQFNFPDPLITLVEDYSMNASEYIKQTHNLSVVDYVKKQMLSEDLLAKEIPELCIELYKEEKFNGVNHLGRHLRTHPMFHHAPSISRWINTDRLLLWAAVLGGALGWGNSMIKHIEDALYAKDKEHIRDSYPPALLHNVRVHLAVVKKDLTEASRLIRSNPQFSCHLNLHLLDLRTADLSNTDLRGANFFSTNFGRACFRNADLRDACFSQSCLSDVDFTGADLRGAIFQPSNCFFMDLRKAILDSDIKNFLIEKVRSSSFYGDPMVGDPISHRIHAFLKKQLEDKKVTELNADHLLFFYIAGRKLQPDDFHGFIKDHFDLKELSPEFTAFLGPGNEKPKSENAKPKSGCCIM